MNMNIIDIMNKWWIIMKYIDKWMIYDDINDKWWINEWNDEI